MWENSEEKVGEVQYRIAQRWKKENNNWKGG